MPLELVISRSCGLTCLYLGAEGEVRALSWGKVGGPCSWTWPQAMRWPADAQLVAERRVKFNSRYVSWDGRSERPVISSSTVSPGLTSILVSICQE